MSQKTFLEDHNGDKSSKRLWGSILLANGLLLKNAEWVIGIFKITSNPTMMTQASESLIYAGSVLLGFGVVEFFAKKPSKNEPNN